MAYSIDWNNVALPTDCNSERTFLSIRARSRFGRPNRSFHGCEDSTVLKHKTCSIEDHCDDYIQCPFAGGIAETLPSCGFPSMGNLVIYR